MKFNLSTALIIIVAVVTINGCSKKEDTPESPKTTPAPNPDKPSVSSVETTNRQIEVPKASPDASDKKIPIDCGLNNQIYGEIFNAPHMIKRYQAITYSIPSSTLQSNFGNQTKEYVIPSQVNIITNRGKIIKTGLVPVKVENGLHVVQESFDPINYAPTINGNFVKTTMIYYDSIEEYNESKDNKIESCFILK